VAQQRLRVRRLTDEEGRQLQRIVRRGGGKTDKSIVKWRRSMVVLASAGGNSVEAIARLVQTTPDRVREMIHRFNQMGMASLDPTWAGGRPRRTTTDDEVFIVKAAKTRPEAVGLPLTRWSLRKLGTYLADNPVRRVVIGRERLRAILAANGVTFQRTKTRKKTNAPLRDEELDRIEAVLDEFPDRVFAFDEFGPLALHPIGGNCWSEKGKPQRLRATSTRTAVSASSTAAPAWATICSSASCGKRRGRPTPSPPCARSRPGVLTARRST
jgi:transposase